MYPYVTPKWEIVQELRKKYPAGTRVCLCQMDDMQAPPVGTKGTVVGVDSTGSILVHWDNGSSLNILYGIDSCSIIEEINTDAEIESEKEE